MEPESILELDASALAAATMRGDLRCTEVTRLYLERLSHLNPQLCAVITINPQAQAEAAALDGLCATVRGPLHGVPMLIKDNIDVAGLPTTAGSYLLCDHIPAEDAPLVARLRAAGAVILGKANMTEWANFMTLGMPNGYSSLGGQTVNPWDAGRDTGGSSSGSGVGVAARLCAAAIGTETSGSIVSPAHQNGVVGLKPTLGLVPRTGMVPISHSQDTAGPIVRSVRDAALILSVIAGPDERDEATKNVPRQLKQPEVAFRVGLVTNVDGPTPQESAALTLVRAALVSLSLEFEDIDWPKSTEPGADVFAVLEYEFKGDLNAYLQGVIHGPKTLAEVIEQNELDPARLLRYGQTLLRAAQSTRGDCTEPAYALARARDLRVSRTQGFDPFFASGLDVVIFPGIRGYKRAAQAGYPSLALPVYVEDQPSGVLLVAPAGADQNLLTLAAELERELGGVRFPEITL